MPFAGRIMVRCHSLTGACLRAPPAIEHTQLSALNIGAAITLRKQEGAAQGMQCLLQEYKHGLHWNRLHTLYKH